MARGPNLFFRQRDLVRVLRSARLAGVPHARVEIDKQTGNLIVDARLGEAPPRAVAAPRRSRTRKPPLRGTAKSKTLSS
jgi:hypothetical protein